MIARGLTFASSNPCRGLWWCLVVSFRAWVQGFRAKSFVVCGKPDLCRREQSVSILSTGREQASIIGAGLARALSGPSDSRTGAYVSGVDGRGHSGPYGDALRRESAEGFVLPIANGLQPNASAVAEGAAR